MLPSFKEKNFVQKVFLKSLSNVCSDFGHMGGGVILGPTMHLHGQVETRATFFTSVFTTFFFEYGVGFTILGCNFDAF